MKLTPEEKKQREILKWEKEKAKAKTPGYLIYFLLIICVVGTVCPHRRRRICRCPYERHRHADHGCRGPGIPV